MGRIAPPVVFDDEPSDEDYRAVARLHFPSFSASVSEELCDVAAMKQCGFKWLEQVGRRARHEARLLVIGSSGCCGDVQIGWQRGAVGLPALSERVGLGEESERGFSRDERKAPTRREVAAAVLPGARGRGAVSDIAPRSPLRLEPVAVEDLQAAEKAALTVYTRSAFIGSALRGQLFCSITSHHAW